MLSMLLLTVLTGCSKKVDPTKDVTVKWDNGVIKIDGKATAITSYKGYEATINGGNCGLDYFFMLDSAKDVTNIGANTQAILEENMDKIKGKFYYTEYLGSKLTMASDIGNDNWIVCQVLTNGNQPTVVANYASDYIDDLVLTNAQVYVDFGPFKFGNAYDIVEVRNDCALIQSVAKVSKDVKNCTEPYVCVQNDKEYHLMKYSSGKYDYYTYEGYLIQVAAGLDINNYITFD